MEQEKEGREACKKGCEGGDKVRNTSTVSLVARTNPGGHASDTYLRERYTRAADAREEKQQKKNAICIGQGWTTRDTKV